MSLAEPAPGRAPARQGASWFARLCASRRFHRAAAVLPGFRWVARRDGEALFDLVSGFVQSQVLAALVELALFRRLLDDGPADAATLARGSGLTPERMGDLCDAATALGLFRRRRGVYRLSRRGAALLGVPGLEGLIAHHRVLYRDMADPLAVLRGEETELSAFWPYVFGAGAATNPETARRYSDLMADSQVLVAEETLRTVDLSGAREVLDIGGGTGTFLAAIGAAHARPRLHLFDLPAVAPAARDRFAAAGLAERARITSGSFREDPLPRGADVLTLIRVLYDHRDDTVRALLSTAHAALPPGGRLVVSEPMTGGARPNRSGDVYFRFYCMAMGTGTARSAAEIAALLAEAGFVDIETPSAPRPFVTSVVTCRRK